MNWIYLEPNNTRTFPPEGEDVLVSDEYDHYDVAWYLKSSEYKWKKVHYENDTCEDFTSFCIVKWKKIE